MSEMKIGITSIMMGVLIGAFGHSFEPPAELFVTAGVLLMLFGGVGVVGYKMGAFGQD